ncbi:hypothetical protein N7468_007545 [Penicillium chermesinum]|uniref:Uncharacterized protein n=1 Tax=Penicillium chermesinum TaxID=63820 RepID=A0A9W9NUB8_9EURO|nr:uncharacterized protein N7468_007545 [Penicillium chermesinum]KAJ5226320.1 hypothetical protein N7468_007545 [Penicillium chermesinum]
MPMQGNSERYGETQQRRSDLMASNLELPWLLDPLPFPSTSVPCLNSDPDSAAADICHRLPSIELPAGVEIRGGCVVVDSLSRLPTGSGSKETELSGKSQDDDYGTWPRKLLPRHWRGCCGGGSPTGSDLGGLSSHGSNPACGMEGCRGRYRFPFDLYSPRLARETSLPSPRFGETASDPGLQTPEEFLLEA